MSAEIVRLETRVEKAWREYLSVQNMAAETGSAADQAVTDLFWAKFISEFVPAELRDLSTDLAMDHGK